jgi:hypothetical protein
MKTLEINLYTYEELTGGAKETAIKNYRERLDSFGDYAWISEIQDSLDAVRGLIGELPMCHEFDMRRSMAWLENSVLSWLRIPWTGPKRDSVRQYGSYYRPGLLRPAPLTGVCYDEDLIGRLSEAIRGGCNPAEAVRLMEIEAGRLADQEIESQRSSEYISEILAINGHEFTEDGTLWV